MGMCHAAKVGCVHPGELKTQLGRDPKVGKLVEEELEMARAWLCDQDLLRDHNSKESLLNGLFPGVGHYLNASLGTQLMKPHGAPSCTICCLRRQACGHLDRYRVGLGPKVPRPSGPHQCRAHPGKAAPPAPRGGSLAGHTPR